MRVSVAFIAALLLAVLPFEPASAKTEHFRIDPVHTRVAFQVSHAGFSNPIGSFSQAAGEMDFDPDDLAACRVDVRIPIATLDLGDEKWQGKILDATFFDAKKFPEARFVSSHVEKTGDNDYAVDGVLTLHGSSHPLRLQATFNALKRHPLTFRRTIGFSARGTLDRSDFGMSAWAPLVGNDVRLLIEVAAAKARSADDPEASAADAADKK